MNAHSLKDSLPRTWGPFFGRHGNFTAAQLAAMPLLLEGKNVVLARPRPAVKPKRRWPR